jgi:NitT/TauT family transport system permease protein
MMEAAGLLATGVVIVYMLTIAALYAASDALFMLAQRRLLQWQR